jgi:hypothetical protein
VEQAADRRQLDLFIDGGDALLIQEIVTGLIDRDVGRSEMGLHRLGQEHARHPDLEALTVLVEALTPSVPAAATHVVLTERIELTERRLVPAARRFLGADPDAFLPPVWQALAATAADLPFEATHPRAHRAWLCEQYGEWTDMRAVVEKEPGWADTPLLRYWMGSRNTISAHQRSRFACGCRCAGWILFSSRRTRRRFQTPPFARRGLPSTKLSPSRRRSQTGRP